MGMVFYLKINRDEPYAYRNLQHWIDIISVVHDAEAYIICDKEQVREKIFEKVSFEKIKITIIKSYRIDDQIEYILNNICQPNWRRAGMAHLSTFLDAKVRGISDFYNIDADDTYLMLGPERCAELLKEVRECAIQNNIDIFSMDMWKTRYWGDEWSFGICYTRNNIDWIKYIREHSGDEKYKSIGAVNIDRYFMYLRKLEECKIETWYVPNLRFVHYSNDLIQRGINSGFYVWEDDYLCFPILEAILGETPLTKIGLSKDIEKIDIGLKRNEAADELMNNCIDRESYGYFTKLMNEKGMI